MCDIDTLLSDACSNGFYGAAQNEPQYRGLVLQLLCNGFVLGELAPILGEQGTPIYGENGEPIFFT